MAADYLADCFVIVDLFPDSAFFNLDYSLSMYGIKIRDLNIGSDGKTKIRIARKYK